MRVSSTPTAPARAHRAPPEKPTKTELLAVRPVAEGQLPPTVRKPLPPIVPREEPDERPQVEPAVDDDDDEHDVPTAMREWGRDSLFPAAVVQPTRATLVRLDASAAGQTVLLAPSPTRFGRSRDAEVRLDDEGVSRLHAAIAPAGDDYDIVDLGSRNGVAVNGQLVRRARLRDGDLVQLGPRVSFRFTLMAAAQADVMQQMFEASVRDGLTGAFNRRHLEDRLRGELAYAIRHKSELGLLMIDVDHFKRVNDSYGHPAGDAVLRFVAGTIGSRLRTEDLFARFGGEEFVAVLRGIDLQGTARAGERLRSVLASACAHHEGRNIPITVSMGAASLATCPERSIESLIATADARLYKAKAAGRNRVSWQDEG